MVEFLIFDVIHIFLLGLLIKCIFLTLIVAQRESCAESGDMGSKDKGNRREVCLSSLFPHQPKIHCNEVL